VQGRAAGFFYVAGGRHLTHFYSKHLPPADIQ
jgi:hypothetical protein